MCKSLKFDVEYAKIVADLHNADLVVVYENPSHFMGYPCTCGYYLDEGDYQRKGRESDYTSYICESCGYRVIVYDHMLPKESELPYLIKY